MNKELVDKLLALKADQTITLTPMQGWSEGGYRIEEAHVGAIQAAFLANRPLLVRGDPGLGKSQLAQAIASCFGWGLVSAVIHYNTVIDDLLYTIDHLERLHQANNSKTNDVKDASLEIKNFIQPGKIWQAIAPSTVKEYGLKQDYNPKGTVLLIDEIDKADSSLPNALLEVLDKRVISSPYLQEPIQQKEYPVFTLITSNEERLLPMAFIRRCAILDLRLHAGEEGAEQLRRIYKTHLAFNNKLRLPDGTITKIAEKIIKMREEKGGDEYKPGTSEFLDVIRALSEFPEAKREEQFDSLCNCLVDKRQ